MYKNVLKGFCWYKIATFLEENEGVEAMDTKSAFKVGYTSMVVQPPKLIFVVLHNDLIDYFIVYFKFSAMQCVH